MARGAGSLSTPTSAPTREDLERGTLRGSLRRAIRRALLIILRLPLGFKLSGVETVPAHDAVLVVSNHLHNADPVLLEIAYPRPLHFMAKKEAFSSGLFRFFLKIGGAFPVDRGRADRGAIKAAQQRLAAGIAVAIYPEGTRSPARALQQAHGGAGMLAMVSNAPVQPVVITGSEKLPLNGSKGKLPPGMVAPDPGHSGVRILFGEPFRIPREIDGRKVSSDEATEIIMVEIARLLPEGYRGAYANALAREEKRRALPLSL